MRQIVEALADRGRCGRRMVKELDLFESNHGCGLSGCPGSLCVDFSRSWVADAAERGTFKFGLGGSVDL
jgi:hypothetical protein